MSTESREVAEQLHKWAKKMGFVPKHGEEFPSVEAFQKICKGKTIPLWQSVVRQVKPKDEVLNIQKALILHRLKSGKSLETDPIPGPLCEQIILARKMADKQKEKQELLASIAKQEASIKSKMRSLSKSGHKIQELEAQVDEFKKKQLLFKIKSKECRSKLDYFKEMANVSGGLCPPHPNSKPVSSDTTPEAVIYKCIDYIRDFHAKVKATEIDAMDDSGTPISDSELNTSHLKDLWNQIVSNVNGWGAQQLWETLNSKHFAELLMKITALCGDAMEAIKPSENHASAINNSVAILPAKLTESTLECILLETKIKIKRKELQTLKEELLQIFQASAINSSQLQNVNSNASDVAKFWIDSQSEKAELLGKIEGIKTQLLKLKHAKPNRSLASSNLGKVKEELAKLDAQVEHDRRHLEENLAQLKVVAVRLKAAQAKARAQKSNFNRTALTFLEMSKSKLIDSDSFSPNKPDRLASTMIDETFANLSFNTTLGSIPGKCGQNNLSEMKIQLRESVSKEAKLFIKLPLETVPYVILNGRRVSICNLMVQAPLVTLRSSNVPYRNFLKIVQGPPFVSTPQIIFDQLNVLTHVQALRLYQFLHQLPTPTPLQPPYHVGNLKELTAKQEAMLSEKLEVVNALCYKIDQSLFKVKTNLNHWIERPIQQAVPSDLLVNGRTFIEWCKLYDKEC